MGEDQHPDFYPIFLSMMSSIRQMKEGNMSWEQIEERIVGDLLESQGRQYYIWKGQKCGHPSVCDKKAVIMFIYKEGIVGGCPDHSFPTMNEYMEWCKTNDFNL